jgi:hypothetical protein
VIFSEKKFDENSQLFRRSHAKFTIEKKIHRNASRYSDDSSSGATPEEPAQESQAATGTTVAAEAETQVDSHPVSSQRVRRPPTRLGYGNLGQPTEHWTSINAVHAPATNNMYLHQYPVLTTPPIPFFPPILPMSLPLFPLYWSSWQGPIMPSNIWC